jgi:acyl-CoA reductase-like NAD-dependent aldehyde dehydrogenase
VLPHNIFDRLLLNGYSAEVWSTPGISEAQMRASAGLGQLRPETAAGVGVVLGAGNIFSIAPLDALYELFAHNRTVLLKLNPITDPLLPVFEKLFATFISRGLIRIVTGSIDVGTAAITNPKTAHVHITGSAKSHDAIVFGAGEEGEANKAAGKILLDKPITSELGGVSPTIVVPGRWSKRDLAFQAEHIVTQKLHNNGYNCIASQVLVVSQDWNQRAAFLDAVRNAYARATSRPAYYPGSSDRTAKAVDDHPGLCANEPSSPRILLDGVPSAGDSAFSEEYFSPVLAVTSLPGVGQDFLDAAVVFANTKLAGTLGANIIIHPRTKKELAATFRDSVADLRYGTVGINAWTGVGYLTPRATWGAFPGHVPEDIGSGVGVVHNGLLLDHTERTVVEGPFCPFPRSVFTGHFTISPRPPWFVTNRTAATTGRRLTRFVAAPRWSKLPAIFISALRG